MATWVKFAKAAEMHQVQKKWGTSQTSESDWRKAMVAEAHGAAVFARFSQGTPHGGDANIEVDVTSASVIG